MPLQDITPHWYTEVIEGDLKESEYLDGQKKTRNGFPVRTEEWRLEYGGVWGNSS